MNARAECYWHLRDLLEEGAIALPDDPKLFDELLALQWRPTSDEKVQLESKEELKHRLGRSPDRADCVSMLFSPDGSVEFPDMDFRALNQGLTSWAGRHIPGTSSRWSDDDIGTPLTTDYWI